MKKIILYLSIGVLLLSCEREYYGKTGPLVTNSYGVWRLQKIVSPSKTILAEGLGYEKLILIEPDGSTNNFYSFKDKVQEYSYSFGDTFNEIDKKNRIYFEVSMGINLVKMELIPANDSFVLIMSDFLPKYSNADTLRYHTPIFQM